MLKKRFYIPLLIVFVTTLIIGSFNDLLVSSFLFDKGNAIGIFFAALGEYPAYFVIVFLGFYLLFMGFKFYRSGDKRLFTLAVICGLLGVVLGTYYQGNAIGNANGYNLKGFDKIIGFLVGVIILIPAYFLCKLAVKNTTNKTFFWVAFLLLLQIALSIIFVTILKGIMHRPRYRMLCLTDSVPFKNWWEIFKEYKVFVGSIGKEEFKSFPSGHTSNATATLVAPYLALLFNKNIKRKILLYIIPIIYILLLAYTRIIVGAHFLSDVSMGGLIGIIVFAIFNELIQKKYKDLVRL